MMSALCRNSRIPTFRVQPKKLWASIRNVGLARIPATRLRVLHPFSSQDQINVTYKAATITILYTLHVFITQMLGVGTYGLEIFPHHQIIFQFPEGYYSSKGERQEKCGKTF